MRLIILPAEHRKFAKEGFAVFNSGNDIQPKLVVQRIDDPKGFAEDAGYDFKIPLLESDEIAFKKASEYFDLDENGVILRSK